jgi:hypothetical protein
MKRIPPVLLLSVIAGCFIIVSAVCWHSIEEIHYLKSFFPKQFSVEEAFYASKVELVKIAIISFPLILIIGISLYFLRYFGKDS